MFRYCTSRRSTGNEIYRHFLLFVAKYLEITFLAYIYDGNFPFYVYFKVLNDKGTTGGVIIFLTDGQEDCRNGDIPGGITNPELLQDVVDQKVRIVTIAFG